QILFRPFSQAAPSTARKYGGTALGQSICKRLMYMMDGEISVHSEQGRGSNFVCRIPLLINDEAGHEEESTFGDEDYSQMRILLGEDNATNLIVIKSLINKLGVNVDIAADGEKAIELVCNKQRQFDLILMDCEMPRLDGYQTTEIIRRWEADQGQSATAIFALSAHVMSEHIKKCEAAGMDEHLSKPISLNQLRKAFNHVRSAS
ncbi:MAG: response regulator, partial [Pseudomonadales bacterium]|nr:response regulator [Pseudomonadales bacterium]